MVYLGAYGPMRPEELASLRRRDVDLDHMVIRVRVAEPERTNGKRAPGETKSGGAARGGSTWPAVRSPPFPAVPRTIWHASGTGAAVWPVRPPRQRPPI